jgi:hypothetical protein
MLVVDLVTTVHFHDENVYQSIDQWHVQVCHVHHLTRSASDLSFAVYQRSDHRDCLSSTLG